MSEQNFDNLWQVSRDVGERTEVLGIFVGQADEVALQFAATAAYGVILEPVKVLTPGTPTGDAVDVCFRAVIGSCQTGEEERHKVAEYLKDRPVSVQKGKYKNTCLVDVRSPTAKKQVEAKDLRRQAYALLSQEQRVALNLPANVEELDPL